MTCFVGCKTKNENQKESDFFSRQKQTILFGHWHYANTIWYTAELMLSKDGEFIFYSQNCLARTFTEGKWFKENETIILLSGGKYRLTTRGVPSHFLSPEDTTQVFFDNERLQLKKDTLFFIGQNKILDGHKFTKDPVNMLSLASR